MATKRKIDFDPPNSPSPAKKKRNVICLQTKLEIIKKYRSGMQTWDLAREYGLASSTISTIIKPNFVAKVEELLAKGKVDEKTTHMKFPSYPDIEKTNFFVLINWYFCIWFSKIFFPSKYM